MSLLPFSVSQWRETEMLYVPDTVLAYKELAFLGFYLESSISQLFKNFL